MGNIICYDDPCPNCGQRHSEFPQTCYDFAHDQLVEAQLEENESLLIQASTLVEDMRSYSIFWKYLSLDGEKNT